MITTRRKKIKRASRFSYDWKRAEKLYADGLSDYAIAHLIGCTRAAVRRWRVAASIDPQERLKKYSHQRPDGTMSGIIRPLLAKGLPTSVIAKRANCRPEYVRAFRQREARRAS